MELQVGVKALLKNPDGKYLLLRRNPKKYPEVPPSWDIVGGRINAGRPLFENLQREVKEETGLNLLIEPKLVAVQDILRPDKHVVRLTFFGEIQGQPVIDEENLEARWFTAEEVKNERELDSFFKELIEKNVFKL